MPTYNSQFTGPQIDDALLKAQAAVQPADITKLSGIATGATANSTDAVLTNRANHTGTQAANTITGLGDLAVKNAVEVSDIDAVGTPNSESFFCGDGSWKIPTIDGTKVDLNNQTGTAYTIALADAGKKIIVNSAADSEVIIPANSTVGLPVGSILGVTTIGAGVTSIRGMSGVTINGATASSGNILFQYSGVTLTKIATDVWVAEGNIGYFE